jgi:hypothetical protein
MKKIIKMIISSCLFSMLALGVACATFEPLYTICYFFTWVVRFIYFVISIVLVAATVFCTDSDIVESASHFEPMYSIIPELIVLICSIGIVSLITAGKFVLGSMCALDLIFICIYVKVANQCLKRKEET